MELVDTYFGCDVFSQAAMQKYLPRSAYRQLLDVLENGKELSPDIADIAANAMKDWAIEKGATHYTHWFQPMTGITAEKHDAFINPAGPNAVISDFSGKELIKGEPDASSFPSGGLRATFEARGYTAWDPTSYAFVKDNTLYIPTLFCSYDGSALDKKTPLLRSLDALDHAAVRLLHLLGYENVTKISVTVGPEQEYFLVDETYYKERLDLMVTGRTLFGCPPVKGQELDDHYFGNIQERVKAFMEEADRQLWRLGVYAKTEHKEVAPGQFELAPVYTSTNLANDQNQLVMETLTRCARHHGFVCLLHEKPFAGVNGSGKHNNWSFSTNEGENLLEPGKSPQDNLRFLLILCAIIKAVDEYQDLLRISVATAGNDLRLGADEAPPAIVSIYLGQELTAILDAIAQNREYADHFDEKLEFGIRALPPLSKDTTDRNRTSPFAFTGNKFEFRMLGSNLNISCPNTILNTIVAEELDQFADQLELADKDNMKDAVIALMRKTLQEHGRILYSGNGYSEQWRQEAKARGLSEFKTAADALPHYTDEKNIHLFAKHNVYAPHELHARQTILLQNYVQVLSIEAKTMDRMLSRQIVPAVLAWQQEMAGIIETKERLHLDADAQKQDLLEADAHLARISHMEKELKSFPSQLEGDAESQAHLCAQKLIPLMNDIRKEADALEAMLPESAWPLPDYNQMLIQSFV
jgi:glutamine synthetase